MKTVFVTLLTTFFLTSSVKAQKVTTLVGKIENGSAVLTLNKVQAIKTYRAKLIKYSNIDGEFTNVELLKLEKQNYLLVFSGPTYKSSFFVEQIGSELRAISTISCTTSECSTEKYGCVVKYDGGDIGYCSPCANQGKCTKTSTGESMLN
jgi:hypothetical protein